MNNDLQLYIGYVNNDQIVNFNLKESENINLLNLSNHIDENDINDLNEYYSELCVYYYVWKNQIKSNYVSIGQHRRYIDNVNFNRLDNNEIQVFPILAHTEDISPNEYLLKDGFNSYIICSFIKYLLKNKLAAKEKIFDTIYNSKFKYSAFNVIACNWDVFNKICEFIFGFMQYIMFNGTYNILEDIKQWDEQIKFIYDKNRFIIDEHNLFCNYNYGRVNTHDRNIAAIFELLIPLYGKICYDVFYEENDKKLGVEIYEFNKETIYDQLFKWISKNTFSGTLNYYIKTNEENLFFLKKLINEHWYSLANGNIHIVEEFPENIIILKLNEYIDVNTPYDSLSINNIHNIEKL